jgi:hypothetical protein
MSNAMQTRALVQAQQKSMDRLRTQVEDEEEMEIVHSFDEQVKDTLAKITFATLQYEGNGDSDIEQLKK